VYITAEKPFRTGQPDKNKWVNLAYTGKYPAGDPGVLLYHTKTTPDENNSWFITGQDLLLVAHLLKTGHYPTRRVIAVGGSAAGDARHVQTRLGAPIAHLLDHIPDAATTRCVAGGVFRGHTVMPGDFLGLYETALTVLPEGNEKEFLALFNPGWRKPTYSRIYLSALNPTNLPANCNRHGDERACIACMHCADVCPVDILPQLAYKAVLAGEVEEALAHGLLDCVECGICTCVCPSKIELMETLKTAKAAYRKEQSRG
jgi:Na+-transporting NADH:ubiquinone oxidoreductase subunit A